MFEEDQPAATSDPWSPDVFPSRSHLQALADVTAAMREGGACMLVTGVSGIGKTTLCRALAASGDDRTFATSVLDPRLSADDVLAQLLRDFGLLADAPHARGQGRQQLIAAMRRFLASLKPLAAHALVVVDDAERIAEDVLSALFELSTAAGPAGPLLRVVLVGQPSLEARLREPALQPLGASVKRHVTLIPLDREELLPYVLHRTPADANGSPAATLTQDRVSEVYDQAEGIPSRVNFFVARAVQQAPVTTDVRPAGVPADVAVTEDVNLAPTRSASRRLPALMVGLLVGLLFVAGLGWWWTTRSATQPGPQAPRARAAPTQRVEPASASTSASASGPATSADGTAARPASAPSTETPSATAAPSTAPPGSAGKVASASSASAPATAPPVATYRITVASFRTAARAEAVAAQVQQLKLAVTTRVDRTGSWHQVIAGPFPTIEAARDVQRTLAASGFPETQVTLPSASPATPER